MKLGEKVNLIRRKLLRGYLNRPGRFGQFIRNFVVTLLDTYVGIRKYR